MESFLGSKLIEIDTLSNTRSYEVFLLDLSVICLIIRLSSLFKTSPYRSWITTILNKFYGSKVVFLNSVFFSVFSY